MAHPWHHAIMAARAYGGVPTDYLALESWMDYTKSHVADCRHRLFLHNAWGIFVAERILGVTLKRASDGKVLPTRPLLEDHVLQDFGKIPTLAYCLAQLPALPLADEVTTLAQCQQAVAQFGGEWADYQPVHAFLDWPRDYLPDERYRRILHNGWGVALTIEAFGETFTRPSDGVVVATRAIAESHINNEYVAIPTLEDCLTGISIQRWMCLRAMPATLFD
ncbi:MAG: hypothetical protein H0X24_13755 [Ktedonobacterales bacterium]|nr:hypothetical protein [Ktedonobacterales bacterium]